MKNILNILKNNIKFSNEKFIKEYYKPENGFLNLFMLIFWFSVYIYYAGWIFISFPIICILEIFIDDVNSNKNFIKHFTWIKWTITILLIIYGLCLYLINNPK